MLEKQREVSRERSFGIASGNDMFHVTIAADLVVEL
jgi:hypothetical protein